MILFTGGGEYLGRYPRPGTPLLGPGTPPGPGIIDKMKENSDFFLKKLYLNINKINIIALGLLKITVNGY